MHISISQLTSWQHSSKKFFENLFSFFLKNLKTHKLLKIILKKCKFQVIELRKQAELVLYQTVGVADERRCYIRNSQTSTENALPKHFGLDSDRHAPKLKGHGKQRCKETIYKDQKTLHCGLWLGWGGQREAACFFFFFLLRSVGNVQCFNCVQRGWR